MPELDTADLPAEVLARFDNNAVTAQAAIDSTLSAARRYCGWHVSPVRTDDPVEMDGPGGRVLSLPTLNLISVASVTELGATVDVTRLDRSRRKGTLTKRYGCWSRRDGAITATITHGFTEEEAADWRAAILAVVGERSLADSRDDSARRDDPRLATKKVDDVQYNWFDTLLSTDEELAAKFSQFRILPGP